MKKTFAILLGVLGIVLYYVHRYIFRIFGYPTAEQIFYTISHSTAGTDPMMMGKAYRYAGWALFFSVVWSLSILFSKQLSNLFSLIYTDPYAFWKKVKTSFCKMCYGLGRFYLFFWKHYLWFGIIIGTYLLGSALYSLDRDFGLFEFLHKKIKTEDCKFIEDNVYFPQIDEIRFENGKKNLVIIMGESLEETFNDEDVEGAPLLTHCASEATRGQSMPNMYSPPDCGWTIGALTAWHFGLPLKTLFNIGKNEYISERGFLPKAVSIFDLLRNYGYKLELLSSVDADFAGNKGLFLHGKFSIIDKNDFIHKGYDFKEYRGFGNGFSDKFILQRARDELADLLESSQPFVLFVKCNDTHCPNGFSPDRKREFGDIRDAFKYVDKELFSFIREVNQKENCVVALIGDHLLEGREHAMWIPKSKRENRKECRLFNAFWGDIPRFETKKKNVVMPYDIAPTLLEAAGARWNTRRYGLGVSFFSPEPSLGDSIGIDEMYEQITKNSKYYNSLY